MLKAQRLKINWLQCDEKFHLACHFGRRYAGRMSSSERTPNAVGFNALPFGCKFATRV
jgi:hypothetical protein